MTRVFETESHDTATRDTAANVIDEDIHHDADAVAGLGQAGEDRLVGVDLQAFDDLGLQLAFAAVAGLANASRFEAW